MDTLQDGAPAAQAWSGARSAEQLSGGGDTVDGKVSRGGGKYPVPQERGAPPARAPPLATHAAASVERADAAGTGADSRHTEQPDTAPLGARVGDKRRRGGGDGGGRSSSPEGGSSGSGRPGTPPETDGAFCGSTAGHHPGAAPRAAHASWHAALAAAAQAGARSGGGSRSPPRAPPAPPSAALAPRHSRPHNPSSAASWGDEQPAPACSGDAGGGGGRGLRDASDGFGYFLGFVPPLADFRARPPPLPFSGVAAVLMEALFGDAQGSGGRESAAVGAPALPPPHAPVPRPTPSHDRPAPRRPSVGHHPAGYQPAGGAAAVRLPFAGAPHHPLPPHAPRPLPKPRPARKDGAEKGLRVSWSQGLQDCFVAAIEAIGGLSVAAPARILAAMGVPGLTRENVASHLQKHRLRLGREAKERGARLSAADAGLVLGGLRSGGGGGGGGASSGEQRR